MTNTISQNSQSAHKLELGVNIDHVATLRQARHTAYPDVTEAALRSETAGATCITAHLREDRRHIQDEDVRLLRRKITTRLNMEMANVPEIVAIAREIHPDEVCLVPEKRQELTTEGGLDVIGGGKHLAATVKNLQNDGVAVSLFIAPDRDQINAAAEMEVPFIELHTGTYCELSGREQQRELARLITAAEQAHQLGIQVNAGHGLSVHNLKPVLQIPHMHTLNIGHSIICRAVFVGIENAVTELLEIMAEYKS